MSLCEAFNSCNEPELSLLALFFLLLIVIISMLPVILTYLTKRELILNGIMMYLIIVLFFCFILYDYLVIGILLMSIEAISTLILLCSEPKPDNKKEKYLE